MNEAFVVGLGKDAIWTAVQVGAPVLGVSLLVGLVISLVQAVTQVNEASLSFVPKGLAVLATLVFFGPWMLNTLVAYTASVFNALPAFAK